ncbi:MAG: DJ-1/PfpI family protein, partial [Oligoflexia bacterium]|nr:DJ-1/PfpI family protein [Oligoflexia bacterium]
MKFTRIFVYLCALLVPPALVGLLLTFSTLSTLMLQQNPVPLEGARSLPAPPRLPGQKPRAAIVLGNDGTQLAELLISYGILAESGAFEVFTAAPERELSATTGPLTVLPHFAFRDAPPSDVLVLPSVLNPRNPLLQSWVRERAAAAKAVLILGEGARLAAQAGLLNGRTATTHFVALEALRREAPGTRWITDLRYVSSGELTSSEGLTATFDATLALVEQLAGAAAAQATAKRVGWEREPATAPMPSRPAIGALEAAQLFLRGGYDWSKDRIATLVYPGVSELALAAPLDVFPRTHSAFVLTVGARRQIFLSRHGLALVPSESATDQPRADFLIVPGRGTSPLTDPLRDPELHRWIIDRNVLVKNFGEEAPAKSFVSMVS